MWIFFLNEKCLQVTIWITWNLSRFVFFFMIVKLLSELCIELIKGNKGMMGDYIFVERKSI